VSKPWRWCARVPFFVATSNPGAFRNAWNEFMRETFLPKSIPPLSCVESGLYLLALQAATAP